MPHDERKGQTKLPWHLSYMSSEQTRQLKTDAVAAGKSHIRIVFQIRQTLYSVGLRRTLGGEEAQSHQI
jgi:hypothetical protein